jgi:hypothetical protein
MKERLTWVGRAIRCAPHWRMHDGSQRGAGPAAAAMLLLCFSSLAATVLLEWEPSPSDQAVECYKVYQATNVDGPFCHVGTVPAPATNWIGIDLTPGVYFWYVTASNFWGESEASNKANTPAPPRKVNGTAIKLLGSVPIRTLDPE